MKYHQTIVIGGGLAGLRAAIALNQKNVSTAVISKTHPLRSHSIAAQGGINAALGNHHRGEFDSPMKHAFDTVKGSDYLADQDAAILMCEEAPKRIYEMEHWGCPFSRLPGGRIAQRPFGGAGFPRTCYAADRTGHVLLHTLYEQATRFMLESERGQMKFYDEWMALRLIVDSGTCRGVIAMNVQTGELEAFIADAVIFATGGSGRIYQNTTNALISTGFGVSIPYRAGVPLKDMEFIQFHPTTLYGTNILMTEGCRGEGGILINKHGHRFLADYDDSKKAMEVAPRDIVARNMQREILAGRGFEDAYLLLDLRHLGEEKIMKRLPGIRELSINFAGVDPVKEPIPVQPGQHYTMGGIDTDKTGATEMEGLYAAGECACVSVHGANRLGGNSLLETIVFGAIAGWSAADYVQGKSFSSIPQREAELQLKAEQERLDKLMARTDGEHYYKIRDELGLIMKEKVGIFRDRSSLEEALQKVRELKERYSKAIVGYSGKRANFALCWFIELGGNLDVAEAIIAGALAREESRGSHFRTDFPKRDDEKFLKHTLAYYTKDGPRLEYKPVTLGTWEPKERKY